jgi:NhaP-type Na+/H+ or K+/H+ antiporter
MTWALAVLALAVLLVAAISRLLTGTPVTPAMVFVAVGVVAGPEVFDAVALEPTSAPVRTLAEATLAVVLFSDASRIALRRLEHERAIPLRLLGIGLPLTIALGAALAAVVLGDLSTTEAVVLAVVLAPTDAALGQAVVTEPRLPSRVRQGLNVESGLNDGICVPVLLVVLAAGEVRTGFVGSGTAAEIVARELGFGVLGGLAGGLVAAGVVAGPGRRGLVTEPWLPVVPVAGAALAYGTATALDGSGFIAAFLAGGLFGGLVHREAATAGGMLEAVGDVLDGVTFVIFGAVLLGPALPHVDGAILLYAILSLTVVRMAPVAVAMLGSGARAPTVAFLGWFGPRGLASIVFAVLVLEDADLPQVSTILVVTSLTVGLSVLLHGLSAAPLAGRLAAWSARVARSG